MVGYRKAIVITASVLALLIFSALIFFVSVRYAATEILRELDILLELF